MKSVFSEIEPSPGQPSQPQTEPFSGQLFLLAPPSLPVRLRREIRLACLAFKDNPSGFIKALLKGDGFTRQRLALLQSGAALAVAAYSLLFVISSLLSLYIPTQAETPPVALEGPPLRLIPVAHKIRKEAVAHRPANKNSRDQAPAPDGSSLVPRKSHGGGSGGDQNPKPSQLGALPLMQPQESIVKPNIDPPKFIPTLPVTPHIVGDAQALLNPKSEIGNPNGMQRTLSNGPGTGKGIGDNQGYGVGPGTGDGGGPGEGGNVGGDKNDFGSAEHGGPGDGPRYAVPPTRPIILYKEKAKYTEEARQNRVMGIVVLNVVFSADGQIGEIRSVRSLPDGLTEEAIKALRKVRFRPATRNGQPVTMRMNIEFSFNIY